MTEIEEKKKGHKKRRKKRRDMGSFFFRLTQIFVACIFIGAFFLFYQTGYIQKVTALYEEAQTVSENSSREDFQTDQSGEVYDVNAES